MDEDEWEYANEDVDDKDKGNRHVVISSEYPNEFEFVICFKINLFFLRAGELREEEENEEEDLQSVQSAINYFLGPPGRGPYT